MDLGAVNHASLAAAQSGDIDINTWPGAILALGFLVVVAFLIAIAVAGTHEFRKTRILAQQEESLRQLVSRYEQLAENTMDAQKRIAADMSELRTRANSIEQILRTVE